MGPCDSTLRSTIVHPRMGGYDNHTVHATSKYMFVNARSPRFCSVELGSVRCKYTAYRGRWPQLDAQLWASYNVFGGFQRLSQLAGL
jgi:hypothetical protein